MYIFVVGACESSFNLRENKKINYLYTKVYPSLESDLRTHFKMNRILWNRNATNLVTFGKTRYNHLLDWMDSNLTLISNGSRHFELFWNQPKGKKNMYWICFDYILFYLVSCILG